MAGSCKTFIVLLVLLSSLCSYKATEGDRVCDDGKVWSHDCATWATSLAVLLI